MISCNSAKKYNQYNNTPISVKKLHQDVDYLQKMFLTMHPDADLYISKDSLNYLFKQAKSSITTPISPIEYYSVIAPVITAVKQGHSRVIYPSNKITKQQVKAYKKTRGPLNQFTYQWINDTLFITENNTKNKNIPIGSAVLKINGIDPKSLFQNYIKNNASDGFNTTYYNNGFNKRFGTLFTDKFGTLDSINFTLFCQDSIFKITNKRFKIEKENKAELKLAKRENKQKLKQNKRNKKILGVVNNQLNRQLLFPIPTDSTYAVLKILSFNSGSYKKAYDSLFRTIKEKKINHLVLDLKDNPGGLVADIDELYSYLKTENIPLLSESSVTNKSKLPFHIIKGWPTWQYIALAPIFPPYYTWIYLNTKKDPTGNYQFKMSGLKTKKIKQNAYAGKLDILVNAGSFSASCIITSNLQGSQRAKVFGEETGGTFNGTVAGVIPLLKLPNSKLKVRTGLMHIKPYKQTIKFGRGIFPDVPIKPTTDNILFNTNIEYQQIYKQK